MPCMDGGDHGGISQGLPLEELVLHALVGIPKIGLMERDGNEHDSQSKAPERREEHHPAQGGEASTVQTPPCWGALSRFAGAGTSQAASAALCWLSPAVLGSKAQQFGGRCPALLTPGVAAALIAVLANCPMLKEGIDVVPVSLPTQHPFTQVALRV